MPKSRARGAESVAIAQIREAHLGKKALQMRLPISSHHRKLLDNKNLEHHV
jgi:hypothetical protein